MMEAQLLLAVIAQQVELQAEPGFELRLAPVVTLRPEGSVPMRVRRREPPLRAAAE